MARERVLKHLKKKLEVWVLHELKSLIARIIHCESLLNLNKIDQYLKRMVRVLKTDHLQQRQMKTVVVVGQ